MFSHVPAAKDDWQEKQRMDIPCSMWLPNTDHSVLAFRLKRYLRNGLGRITHGSVQQAELAPGGAE
jgi:hypothetical protein